MFTRTHAHNHVNCGCLCHSDIDECADGGMGNIYCSQGCVNTPGSYSCSCTFLGFALYTEPGAHGFDLAPNENGLVPGDAFFINHTCVRT